MFVETTVEQKRGRFLNHGVQRKAADFGRRQEKTD